MSDPATRATTYIISADNRPGANAQRGDKLARCRICNSIFPFHNNSVQLALLCDWMISHLLAHIAKALEDRCPDALKENKSGSQNSPMADHSKSSPPVPEKLAPQLDV